MNRSAIQWNEPQVGIEKPRQTVEAQVGELINRMLRLDAQSEKFRDCTYNPDRFPSLKECVKWESSMLSVADKYKPMQFPANSIGQYHKPLFSKKWVLYEILTQIELAKALPFFSNLSESDRFCLAQDTVLMSTHLTRAFYSYEQKSDRLIRPDGIGYYDQPFLIDDNVLLRLRDDIGMRCLGPILRNGLDRVEFVLLRVLVLTNPGVSKLSDFACKYLTKERQKYNIALFRYVMAKHGASGPARYGIILGFIDILERQQRDHRDLSAFMSITKVRHNAISLVNEVMKH